MYMYIRDTSCACVKWDATVCVCVCSTTLKSKSVAKAWTRLGVHCLDHHSDAAHVEGGENKAHQRTRLSVLKLPHRNLKKADKNTSFSEDVQTPPWRGIWQIGGLARHCSRLSKALSRLSEALSRLMSG